MHASGGDMMDARHRYIGREIKSELVKRGLRQVDIARRLNLDRATVNRQLNAATRADFFVLMSIIEELGLDAHELYRKAKEAQHEIQA
jgi:transcriptional regulator with XRE-family HTH domain